MGSAAETFQGDLFVYVSVYATRANRHTWGDTQYAEGLLRAIRAVPGCDGALLFRNEVPKLVKGRDVVLRIIGPVVEDPLPGVPNLLWMISPPNVTPAATLARYQAVFCGSGLFAQHLRKCGVAAQFLPQATEVAHFHPARRRAGARDIPVAFVGAYAPRADRQLVLHAVNAGYDVRIWGPGWRGIVPDACWQGERLDYDQLAETYAAARIVLNSHMPQMAERGYMSNRSFDALASGARVICDPVAGFAAADLPELVCVSNRAELIARLDALLALPLADAAQSKDLHDRIARVYGFAARAAVFVACARGHLAAGQVALQPGAFLKASPDQGRLQLSDPAASASSQEAGMLAAAEAILRLAAAYPPKLPPLPPQPCAQEGVIHPLMADLREMQALFVAPFNPDRQDQVAALTARALRLVEVLRETAPALALHAPASERDAILARLVRNEPLWAHTPDGYHRDSRKIHLALRPRRESVALHAPVGVFLHLYHPDLAQVFAERLKLIDAAVCVYVSTDTDEKAAQIAQHLPQADIRVMPNRGRDIWAKLYGFADAYARHDIVLHLHGKKSQHSERLNDWLSHILDCLLPSREGINRILSLFQAAPTLGLVTPMVFRSVLNAAHWGANFDLARELAIRLQLKMPLPDTAQLQFPVGSMFWGRSAAIRPLLDLQLTPAHFPPELGQVDGTTAHAIERMLGVVCQATGHHILPVCGADQSLHAAFRKQFDGNRALRAALEAGLFSPIQAQAQALGPDQSDAPPTS